MLITSENWGPMRAAKMAYQLSRQNPDTSFTVYMLPDTRTAIASGDYCPPLDWQYVRQFGPIANYPD